MSRDQKEKQDRPKPIEKGTKKPYTEPLLVIYGSVERITEASQNTGQHKDSNLSNPENRSR
ncbi:MAG: hypothetical protein WBG50_24540 [Desulfomonilaceae bacterium]